MVAETTVPKRWRDSLLDLLGPLASAARKNYVLTILVAVTVIVTGLLPKLAVNDKGAPLPWTTPVVIVAICVGAIAVLFDRFGDDADKRVTQQESERVLEEARSVAALEYEGSVATAERSASELNTFLQEAIEVSFLGATSRSTEVRALRRHLARSAANSIGPNTRATYYTLQDRTPGKRVLGDPKHSATVGRRDKPLRPWIEEESPEHDIWKILDQPDEHQDVHEAPDSVKDVVWENVRYDTFLTIPIKAEGVVFGVLSVNNAAAGSIGEVQRSVIVSMARTMALVLALDAGPQNLKNLTSGDDLSHGAVTLYEDEEDNEELEDETDDE